MINTYTVGYFPKGQVIKSDVDARLMILRKRYVDLKKQQNRGLGLHHERLLAEEHETCGFGHNYQGKGTP